MYRQIQDFLGSWAYEREAMLKVLDAMTDESLGQQVYGPAKEEWDQHGMPAQE